jgi:hypothetical protein
MAIHGYPPPLEQPKGSLVERNAFQCRQPPDLFLEARIDPAHRDLLDLLH